jgi:tyrosine ammonia-lyase
MIELTITKQSFVNSEIIYDLAHDKGSQILLAQDAQERVQAAHKLVRRKVAEGDWIYGYSSGFGPLAMEDTALEDNPQQQKNLLYHLASGQGQPLSLQVSRAILALRIRQLALGYSGISLNTLEQIITIFNAGFSAIIPSLGSVGASGDLTPLAHLALSLAGEGEVYMNAAHVEAELWFKHKGLAPIFWQEREALAFVNGTACMTALAALNLVQAQKALARSEKQVFIYAEMLGAFREAWHPLLAQARPHSGQKELAEKLYHWSLDSDYFIAEEQFKGQDEFEGKWPQDPYSIRCAPQLLGAVQDDLRSIEETINIEINSASDNPTIFIEEQRIIHGGNFNGQHLSFASDKLNEKLIYLAVYSEKRITKICNPKYNLGLSAFLKSKPAGLNSGFMGAQVTATALLIELKLSGKSVSIESLSTNNDNQDMVSLGTLSAWRGREMFAKLFSILAIEAMVLSEAIDQRQAHKQRKLSLISTEFHKEIRSIFPPLKKDRALAKEISALAQFFSQY